MFLIRTIIEKASQWLTLSAAPSLRLRLPNSRWPGSPLAAGLHRGGSAAVNPAIPHWFHRAIGHLMLAILSVAGIWSWCFESGHPF